MAHLAVLAFDEGEAHPTCGDVGTVADGRHALPKVFGRTDNFGLAGFGTVSLYGHASFQLVDSLLCDLSVHLGEIGARMLEFRVKQPFDEFSVIGEEQGPLAVVVEAACGIHIGRKTELVECPMPGFGGKLAEYAKRFVE